MKTLTNTIATLKSNANNRNEKFAYFETIKVLASSKSITQAVSVIDLMKSNSTNKDEKFAYFTVMTLLKSLTKEQKLDIYNA
jgi:uncharacterized protein YerC